MIHGFCYNKRRIQNFCKGSKLLFSSFLVVEYKFFRKNLRQGKFEKIRDVTIQCSYKVVLNEILA